jgi:thioredoxin reductase (NADPH)
MVKESTEFDVMIAGGGPAGLSALLWCADLGLRAILFEREAEFGGQLLLTHNAIQNYLGVEAANGSELRDIFLRQIEKTKMKRLTGAVIVEAHLDQKTLTMADGAKYSSRAIIIATGVRRRKLFVPGEVEFRGHGIVESGKKAGDEMRGKTVVIVGGGDAALENALILSETASKIFVVHRRSEFTARKEFIQIAQESDKIEFCSDTQITEIFGNEMVTGVELKHVTSGNLSRIETDAVLIRIGVEPNTECFRGQIEFDKSGYIKIDANCATTVLGVFAVGDVANPVAPTIAAAVGQGAVAAKAILRESTIGSGRN